MEGNREKRVLDITLSGEEAYLEDYFKTVKLYKHDYDYVFGILKNDADENYDLLSFDILDLVKTIVAEYDPDYVIIDNNRKATSMLITAFNAYGVKVLYKLYSGEYRESLGSGVMNDISHLFVKEPKVSALLIANKPILEDPSNRVIIDVINDEILEVF